MSEVEFQPFQRVMVRENNNQSWIAALFSNAVILNGLIYYKTSGGYGAWRQCIPYEGNEKYLGKTDTPIPLETEFQFGEKVEVRDEIQDDWMPAIYVCRELSHTSYKVICKGSSHTSSYIYCRHADW